MFNNGAGVAVFNDCVFDTAQIRRRLSDRVLLKFATPLSRYSVPPASVEKEVPGEIAGQTVKPGFPSRVKLAVSKSIADVAVPAVRPCLERT